MFLGPFFPNVVRQLPVTNVVLADNEASCMLRVLCTDAQIMHGMGCVGGQVLFAVMDTLMTCALHGIPGVTGTLQSSVSFQRPVAVGLVKGVARVDKINQSNVFGTVQLFGADDNLNASATFVFGRNPAKTEMLTAEMLLSSHIPWVVPDPNS